MLYVNMPAKGTYGLKNVFTINKYSHNLLLNKHFFPSLPFFSCDPAYTPVLLSLNSSPTEINGSFKRSKVSQLYLEEAALYVLAKHGAYPLGCAGTWCGAVPGSRATLLPLAGPGLGLLRAESSWVYWKVVFSVLPS